VFITNFWIFFIVAIAMIGIIGRYFENEAKKTTLREHKLKSTTTKNANAASSSSTGKPLRLVQRRIDIRKDLPSYQSTYCKFFDSWTSDDFVNLDTIESQFIEFCEHFKLPSTFKDDKNFIRFRKGEVIDEDGYQILFQPYIYDDEIQRIKRLKKTYYTKKDEDEMSKMKKLSDVTLRSLPIQDELLNFKSKESLRIYFHSIEIAFLNYLKNNCQEHCKSYDNLVLIAENLKTRYKNLKVENTIIENDLYNMLLNLSKSIDSLLLLKMEMLKSLDVPIYKDNYIDTFNNWSGFESYGASYTVRDAFFSDIMKKWVPERRVVEWYSYYRFKDSALTRERFYIKFEKNFFEIVEWCLYCISTYEFIISQYSKDDNFKSYLMLKIDLDKYGLFLNHFEASVIENQIKLDFNIDKLYEILVKNNNTVLESLDKIRIGISNASIGLNSINESLAGIGKKLDVTNSNLEWSNFYQIANLYFNYRTNKSLRSKLDQ
jgi:hypothetical protein